MTTAPSENSEHPSIEASAEKEDKTPVVKKNQLVRILDTSRANSHDVVLPQKGRVSLD